MRNDNLPESSNVEDRRGEAGAGGFRMPSQAGGMSIGAIVVLGLVGWALGIDPSILIGGAEILTRDQPRSESSTLPRRTDAPKDDIGNFVSRVLGSTEAAWRDILAKDGKTYHAPILVLYNARTDARCGSAAQSAMGPFYCPVDQRIYLDTSFFSQIETRFHGCDAGSKSCQFSQAYVIAHEVGHHVQNLLGALSKAHSAQQAAGGSAEANHIQVQIELQADCFAGVWANKSEEKWQLLQPGDVETALRTAAAIGDDTLQRRARGEVVPDSFTHGTSEQRQRWFSAGLKGGTVASCNTFGATRL